MPSRNTLSARTKGYSDMTRMEKDNPKSPSLKNFGVRLGVCIDSGGERQKRGRKPHSPRGNSAHWKDTPYERAQRKNFFRPQINQRD